MISFLYVKNINLLIGLMLLEIKEVISIKDLVDVINMCTIKKLEKTLVLQNCLLLMEKDTNLLLVMLLWERI
jgi:hypothetical protein